VRHRPQLAGGTCWATPGCRRPTSNRQLQADELTAAGWERVYVDQASGSLDRRLELDRVLGGPAAQMMSDLDERGIGFRSLREVIDTTTPAGRLVSHLFASLAAV